MLFHNYSTYLRSFPLFFSLFFFLFSISSSVRSEDQIPKDSLYISDEIIVVFKDQKMTRSSSRFKNFTQNMMPKSSQLIKQYTHGQFHFKIPEGSRVEEVVAQIKKSNEVKIVQPNYIYHALSTGVTPNDPLFASLWGLKNTGQTIQNTETISSSSDPIATNNPGTTNSDMSLSQAWSYHTDCSNTIVAVLDTGVRYTHGDIAANMWDGGFDFPYHGYNFVNNDNLPLDLHGHGTHVAGTLGAVGNNNYGSTGICWQAKIMAVKVLDDTGVGTTSSIIAGIQWAQIHGAKIINLSLGSASYDPSFQAAISDAGAHGVLVVSAAGNDGTNNNTTPEYPCNYSLANNLCVGALDQSFSLASFSNYGTNSVHVTAPGTNIISLYSGKSYITRDESLLNWNPITYNLNYWSRFSTTSSPFYYLLGFPETLTQTNYNANSSSGVYKVFDLSQ